MYDRNFCRVILKAYGIPFYIQAHPKIGIPLHCRVDGLPQQLSVNNVFHLYRDTECMRIQ